MSFQRIDVWPRQILRDGYRFGVGLAALASLFVPAPHGKIRIFYGGARAGDIGGPLVKVKRLREQFPECRLGFTVVYALSNAPYLPGFALRAIKARDIPIVVNQNGVFYPAWYGGNWRAMNAEMAPAYHFANYVFWQSAFCRRAADNFLGKRQGPGEVLYNAVDTAHFKPAGRQPSRPFAFLLTGKIDAHLFYRIEASLKGLAAARAKGLDGRLILAGWFADDALRRTNEMARALGVTNAVSYAGSYTQEQAPSVYQQADAYVMLKHNDPCPNTVLEAMACGLPVVYSDTGGVHELVGEDSGIAVPCEEDWERPRWPDADAVATAMMAVAENHDRLAAAARKRATDRFDIVPWIERHRAMFASLVGEDA